MNLFYKTAYYAFYNVYILSACFDIAIESWNLFMCAHPIWILDAASIRERLVLESGYFIVFKIEQRYYCLKKAFLRNQKVKNLYRLE